MWQYEHHWVGILILDSQDLITEVGDSIERASADNGVYNKEPLSLNNKNQEESR
jgi:hypothetical protein